MKNGHAKRKYRAGLKPITKGDPRAGRKVGQVNRTTRLLKEAILLAAEAHGSDGKGKNKLVGYLEFLARKHVHVFGTLLGRLLPMQIKGHVTANVRPITDDMSEEQAIAAYAETVRAIDADYRVVDDGKLLEDRREENEA